MQNQIPHTFPNPDTQQQKAARHDTSVWVSASAGTGKTKVLTDRVLNLLLSGVKPEKILCLTFTKAAAAEMSNRIASKLGNWAIATEIGLEESLLKLLEKYPDEIDEQKKLKTIARRLFSQVLDTPGGMRIQTIHSFCQTLLKQFPIEAGIAPHFNVMDDRDAEETLNDVRSFVLSRSYNNQKVSNAFKCITSMISGFSFENVIKEITGNRHNISNMISYYGDTKTINLRLRKELGLDENETSETIIASAYKQLNEEKLKNAIEPLNTGGKEDKKKAATIAEWCASDEKIKIQVFETFTSAFLTKDKTPLSRTASKAIIKNYPDVFDTMSESQQILSTACIRLKSLKTAEATEALITIGHTICNSYQEYKNKRSLMDYDDLINSTKKLLQTPGITEWVLFKLDGGIDHILVDEAQDTNPEQWDIIESLSGEFFAHQNAEGDKNPRTIFAVGDRKQSIYSFQGADPKAFEDMRLKLQKQIPMAGYKWDEVELYTSFRSTRAVLQAVNNIIQHSETRNGILLSDEDGTHIPFKGRAEDGGLVELWPPLEPTKIDEPAPWKPPVERVIAPSTETRMARIIADRISIMIKNREILESKNRPIKPGDILVLVRTRGKLVTELVKELKRLNIETAGVDRINLLEQIAVQDLIATGNFLLMQNDDLTLATVLKTPLIGLTEKELFELSYNRKKSLWEELKNRHSENKSFENAYSILSELLSLSRTARPHELYSHLLSKLGGKKKIMRRLGAEAIDAIDEFISLTISFEKSHTPSLQMFLKWINQNDVEIKRDMEQENLNAVRIMTVHGSKGLQAPIVFLTGTLQKPEKTSPLLWLNKKQDDCLMFWPPSIDKSKIDEFSKNIIEQEKGEQNKEYRRQLYVAMTRAEDRLYICGHNNQNNPKDDCWYKLVEKGLSQVATEHSDDFIKKHFGNDVSLLRLSSPQKRKVETKETTAKGKHLNFKNLPTWLLNNPAEEPSPPRPLVPSKPSDDEPTYSSPLLNIKQERNETQITAMKMGTITHKLLQILPDKQADKREEFAYKIIGNIAPDISKEQAIKIVSSVLDITENPNFSHLFSTNSRAEVPIIGLVQNDVISGVVDRLVVTDTEVNIIDYKTGVNPPLSEKDIPPIYIKQMAAYKKVLSNIYPDKKITCSLLWTENLSIMGVGI